MSGVAFFPNSDSEGLVAAALIAFLNEAALTAALVSTDNAQISDDLANFTDLSARQLRLYPLG